MKRPDTPEQVEARLAAFRVPAPSPGLQERVLAAARSEWREAHGGDAAAWPFLKLAGAVAAALVVAAVSGKVNDAMIARAAGPVENTGEDRSLASQALRDASALWRFRQRQVYCADILGGSLKHPFPPGPGPQGFRIDRQNGSRMTSLS